MKNLKRALAVVIALTMVMGTVAFAAAFSDVEDSSAYAEAINLGVALKLFTGYEDGTFKPEGDITRAEFAAIVVRLLAQDSQADGAKGATKFTDVASTHWAAGYINIASNMGIVNGYGDGNFGPEDNVTYEQAVKMIVVALGYEPAVGSAGYPVGYLTIAQQNGITTGVKGTNGVAANRGQVALLVFNSLDVPLMEQTGFGTYVDYIIQDGRGDSSYKKTIMSEYLNIVKLKAIAQESLALKSSKKEDIVKVEVLNNYKTKYDDEFIVNSSNDINVGNTNLASLTGYNVILYVEYDENSSDEPIAVYVKKDIANLDELTVAADDFEGVDLTAGVVTVEFWPEENSRKSEKITINDNAAVYINGYKQPSTTKVSEQLFKDGKTNFNGTATFSLLNSQSTSEDYDTVFITKYLNTVVDSVNTSTGRVTVKSGARISFSESDTNVKSTLYDIDGNELDWKTLKEFDVLSTRRIDGSSRIIYMATLVQNVVTGKITEQSGDISDDKDAEFTIDGNSYKVDGQYIHASDLKLEDEGNFYLDIFGKIAYFEIDSAASNQYAYIIDSALVDGIESRTDMKIFTYKGEIETLRTASRVRVYSANAGKYESTYVDSEDVNALLTKDTLITFGVNSSGEVNKICFANTLEKGISAPKEFAMYVDYESVDGNVKADFVYSTGSIRLNGKRATVTDKTVIMVAPLTTADPKPVDDDYELIAFSALDDDYKDWELASIYDVDRNGEAGAVLLQKAPDFTGGATNVAMIYKQSQGKNSYGTVIDKFTAYQDGESVVLDSAENLQKAIDLDKYPVIVPTKNVKGELKNFKEIALVDAVNKKVVVGSEFGSENQNIDVEYYLGQVTDMSGNRIFIADNEFAIPSTANIYVYDENASKTNIVTVSDINGHDVFEPVKDAKGNVESFVDLNDNELASVYVLAREYEGKIVDVVIYLFKK